MKTAVLTRLETSDQGTFGRLLVDGKVFFTGELPWRENRDDVSCIPAGTYTCRWTLSSHFKRFLFLVGQVPERDGVRIHSANLMGDAAAGFKAQLNGCIALGERLGLMDGQKALLLSAPAVRSFETLMGKKPFRLEVLDGYSRDDR